MKWVVLLVVLLTLCLSFAQASSSVEQSNKVYEVVQIQSGDTVWGIAARYTTDKEDIRMLIMAIREVNQLNNNAQVYPGQLLKIPVKKQDG